VLTKTAKQSKVMHRNDLLSFCQVWRHATSVNYHQVTRQLW